MTLKTWRDEFMPKMPTKRLTKLQAIEHSLRKWRGLTKANLKKHKVEKLTHWIENTIFTEENASIQFLDITDESCALCVKFYNDNSDNACIKCPLFKTLGKPCDVDNKSPYFVWKDGDNPRPMIRALEKTLQREMGIE